MLILTISIITLAFFGESIFGFGGGLISIPLLSLLLGVKDAVTLVLIFQLFMGLLLFGCYKDVNWKQAIPMSIGLAFGTIIGTFMLASFSNTFLKYFLAISIFIFLIKMVFFNGFNFGSHKQKQYGVLAGLVGGWFQGIIGTGGPVFTMYLAVASPAKAVFRAALIYLFFATSIVRIGISIPKGLITQNIIHLALPAIPFFLIAIMIGHFVHKKIDEVYYRYAIWAILFFSAISMLVKH